MIKEAYCSYEVSKLLKEKGFDEYCRYFYDCDHPNTGYLSNKGYGEYINNSKVYDGRNLAACPTHQMAMKWLRESHFLFIDIDPLTGNTWTWSIWFMNDPKQKVGESLQTISTYKEACEAAIKYCLKKIIK